MPMRSMATTVARDQILIKLDAPADAPLIVVIGIE